MKKVYYFFQPMMPNMGFVMTSKIWSLGREHNFNVYDRVDYVRVMSLELISQEIKESNVEGNVAEFGVFQGEFASKINEAFPNKKLYLFDTFEGFNKEEENKDKKENFFTEHVTDFSKTSVDIVLKNMKFPENCIIKKGYFPDTTKDIPIDEQFAFVSIDTDLYDPIYNGLLYFYPRLQKGGYIFIHDYNSVGYKGAKLAVKKFTTENNISFFPLCDGGGTCVISK